MRKTTPQPIGDVLKDVVEQLGQTKKKDIARIFSLWPALAGKQLSRHTQPVSLRRGTLLINVDESAWLYQVNLQKEVLLKRLKTKLGADKIQKLQLRIGDIRR